MPDLGDLPGWLVLATSMLLAVAGFLQAVAAIGKAARAARDEAIKPLWRRWGGSMPRLALLLLSVVAPIGLLAWWVLYVAGAIPNSLSEPSMFYLLVGGLTIVTSVYAILWRLRLYPNWLAPRFAARRYNATSN
jgi:hypothetical protein